MRPLQRQSDRVSPVLEIPLHRLDPDLDIPQRAEHGDAGVDLPARISVAIDPGARVLVPTGMAVAIPIGWAGFLLPRSGLALRHGITVLNAPGLIDSGYRGELEVLLYNADRSTTFEVSRGDRIAQLVVQEVAQVEFLTVDELPDSDRSDQGWGHSGVTAR